MFVHAPKGVFTTEARARVAAELTGLGMACERLANTPEIRSGVWVIFVEHEHDAFFSGGEVASHPILVLLINAIKGGLDDHGRKRLIEEGTAILGRHAAISAGKVPVRRHPGDPRDQLGDVRKAGRPFRDARASNHLTAFKFRRPRFGVGDRVEQRIVRKLTGPFTQLK
jgi:hypothetical protein